MRRILAAASDWRSLIWLGAGMIGAAALSNPFPALIGLGLYLWAVQRVSQSPQLAEAAERSRIARDLAERHKELLHTGADVTRRLPTVVPRGESRSWSARAQAVVNAAGSVYQEWLKQPGAEPEKGRWADEALRLAHHYLRILQAHLELYGQGGPGGDVQAIMGRLKRNQAALEATIDMEARGLLLKAIEMDEKALRHEAQEVADAERYLAKLAAIESTLDLLRRRFYEPAATEDANRIHDLLLEAEAMDEALAEVQHRSRVRA